jgi:hypothetical protein
MIGRRKVVGSAQFRQGGALLQHGSILLEDNQGFVLRLTRGASISHTPQSSQQVSTDPDTARPFRSRDVAAGITRAACARWPGEWNRDPDADPVLRAASSHYAYYRAPAWTWAR